MLSRQAVTPGWPQDRGAADCVSRVSRQARAGPALATGQETRDRWPRVCGCPWRRGYVWPPVPLARAVYGLWPRVSRSHPRDGKG
jgi:hypothetical protein